MFFTFLKLYKWYQIVQRITNIARVLSSRFHSQLFIRYVKLAFTLRFDAVFQQENSKMAEECLSFGKQEFNLVCIYFRRQVNISAGQ